MRTRACRAGALLLAWFAAGCGASEPNPPLEQPDAGAAPIDAGFDGTCASSFGRGLTPGFGRIDGVVSAVVVPSETTCAMPNDDHVVVQVSMGGAVYRMVLNIESDRAGQDPRVSSAELVHALAGPPFAEGWHKDVALDYPGTLGIRSDAFSALGRDALVSWIDSVVRPGDAISIYAESGAGRPDSAHKIHRNTAGAMKDGAIVLVPTSTSPRFLLFRFADQRF